jgi:hypothetical protein
LDSFYDYEDSARLSVEQQGWVEGWRRVGGLEGRLKELAKTDAELGFVHSGSSQGEQPDLEGVAVDSDGNTAKDKDSSTAHTKTNASSISSLDFALLRKLERRITKSAVSINTAVGESATKGISMKSAFVNVPLKRYNFAAITDKIADIASQCILTLGMLFRNCCWK